MTKVLEDLWTSAVTSMMARQSPEQFPACRIKVPDLADFTVAPGARWKATFLLPFESTLDTDEAKGEGIDHRDPRTVLAASQNMPSVDVFMFP